MEDHGIATRSLRQRVLDLLCVEPELRGVRRIRARIGTMLANELLCQVIDKPLVKVLTSQLDVAVGGNGSELSTLDFENRDVERSAA
jgi:hypothetical protein